MHYLSLLEKLKRFAGEIRSMEKRMKIGFIGLGNVGSKLAGSLLRNGFDLYRF